MKRHILPLILLAAAAIVTSCYRDPIYSAINQYRVVLDFDTEPVLYNKPEDFRMALFQLTLYDIGTDREVYKTFVPKEGGYLAAVEPGDYGIAVWQMDGASTDITYQNNFKLLTAETKTLQEAPQKVNLAPSNVYLYSNVHINIPYVTDDDDEYVITIPMKSVTDSWMVEVSGVKGLDNYSSSTFHIYNQIQEILLKENEPYGMTTLRAQGSLSVADSLIVCPFCTFGMPEKDNVVVTVQLLASDGYTHSKTFDVTDQVRDPLNSEHILRVEFDTTLNPMKQGGMEPTADEWEEKVEHLDII